jgi:hypothetical protein
MPDIAINDNPQGLFGQAPADCFKRGGVKNDCEFYLLKANWSKEQMMPSASDEKAK